MKLKMELVKPGMKLERSIYKNEGDRVPLKFVGPNDEVILTEKDIELLKGKGIRDIYVDFELEKVSTISEEQEDIVKQLLEVNNYGEIVSEARNIASNIMEAHSFSYDLNAYFLQNKDMYTHALHTAEFAVAFSKKFHESYDYYIDPTQIAVASFLHEIGKNCNPSLGVEKFKSISSCRLSQQIFPDADNSVFQKYSEENYPLYSWATIRNEEKIDGICKAAILIHQENPYKTGPLKIDVNQFNNKKVAIMAKIINTCAYFDNLLYEIPVSEVVEKVNQDIQDKKVDPQMGKLLLRYIPLYPVGTKVVLSNGLVATVFQENLIQPNRPTLQFKINGINHVINLTVNNHLVISGLYLGEIEEKLEQYGLSGKTK